METDIYLTPVVGTSRHRILAIYSHWEYTHSDDDAQDTPNPVQDNGCNMTGAGALPAGWLVVFLMLLGCWVTKRLLRS